MDIVVKKIFGISALKFVLAVGILLLVVDRVYSAPGDLEIPRVEGSMSIESMPASRFPHWLHRIRYRCDACHTQLFKMKLGETQINMELMSKGESCATCHNGKEAFPVGLESCRRCHVSNSN